MCIHLIYVCENSKNEGKKEKQWSNTKKKFEKISDCYVALLLILDVKNSYKNTNVVMPKIREMTKTNYTTTTCIILFKLGKKTAMND